MPVYLRRREDPFPPVTQASAEGIVAVGGDLSPARLLTAYGQGLFPWYNADCPILWWSPDPRCVLPLDGLHVSRRLRRTLRHPAWQVTVDACFEAVITACATIPRAAPGASQAGGQAASPDADAADAGGTWLLPEMRRAYLRLHTLGYAHSIEVWRDGRLAGGLYGVALGGAFFGESMFHRVTDASKIALVALVQHLNARGFTLLDCQQDTPHSLSMGAVVIPREVFLRRLTYALRQGDGRPLF